LAVVAGCGDGDDNNANTSGSGSGAGGPGSGTTTTSTTGSGGSAGGAVWTPIITAEWQLDPLSENTSDVHSEALTRDIFVGGIRPIAPLGTHHTVLALNGLDAGQIIYASGVGTNAIMFPPGVGLRLSAGETLILQLHLFNTSTDILTGTSGIEVVEIAPEDIVDEANLFLPGPLDFSIPPNQSYTHSGTCTINAAQNLFAIFPHMHQLGTHFTATLTVGGNTQTLHDGDYAFGDQAFIPFDPIAVQPGDSVTTTCTWNNNTTQTVGWGESSTTEMCFAILYRYPAQPSSGFGFCEQ
jgi:hypothetical protein